MKQSDRGCRVTPRKGSSRGLAHRIDLFAPCSLSINLGRGPRSLTGRTLKTWPIEYRDHSGYEEAKRRQLSI